MSVEEDVELRDLVAQTLETNGCLAKIRAQLRASIFLALDDDEHKKEPFLNKKVKEHLESQQGKLMFCLVREFLEYFNLEFTISVYEPETYMGSQYLYEGRSKIVQESKIQQLDDNSTLPLLLQLIQIAQSRNSQIPTHDYSNNSLHINEKDLTNSDKLHNTIDISISNRESLEQGNRTVTPKNSVVINKLNETFDFSYPSNQLSLKHESVVLKNNLTNSQSQNKKASDIVSPVSYIKDDLIEKDDTFEGTSSIAEDSVRDETDRSSSSETEKFKGSPDQAGSDSEISPPVVKDGKFSKFDSSLEKLKLSPQKTEKLKKSSLSSLSDLPPLPAMNKPRCNDMLLPSLYTKEFKEKSNKDIDKMFDFNSLDNYEEDFMSGSEADLVQKKMDGNSVVKSVKLNSDLEVNVVNSYEIDCANKNRAVNDSTISSVASDDFESNSNVEDILNST